MRELEPVGVHEGTRTAMKVWLPQALYHALSDESRDRKKLRERSAASHSAIARDALRIFLGTRLAKGSVGTQLRAARKALGVGIRGAAKATDGELTSAGLSLIERDKHSPRVNSLRALAKALDLTIVIDADGIAVFTRKAS